MPPQPAPANFQPEPVPHAPGQHAADAHYYRQALHELINVGTSLARLLNQQATAQAEQRTTTPAASQDPAPALLPDAPTLSTLIGIAAAFDRIARAVRRSIALARSLADPLPLARDPAHHRVTARKRVLREVEDMIQCIAPAPGHAASEGSEVDDADTLTAELRDYLDAPDLDDDISTRPIAEIITEICRDLGLAALPGTHPWKRRTPADLEQLCARAAAPSRARPPGPGPLAPTAPQHAATNPIPPGPPATPRATSPTHAGSAPPNSPANTPPGSPAEAPADTIASIPRHPTHLHGQWRPPPEPRQTPKGPHRQPDKPG